MVDATYPFEAARDRSRGAGATRADRKQSRFAAGRDLQSRVVAFMIRRASRLPDWRLQTMEVLVQSETEGIRMLEAARPAISDPRLRRQLDQHLIDERRHASGFAERFESLQKEAGLDPRPAAAPRAQQMQFNVMEMIAYLEIQELRGGQVLEVYRDLFDGDEVSIAFIESVVTDEKFHASYTHRQLERWIDEGLANEVAAARRLAKKIDRGAFWAQARGFIALCPRLLLRSILPGRGVRHA